MMTGGGNRDSLMADINVTPFVDVMLVLLIIFMVTAPMMVQGVNVDLPEATTETLPSEEEHLVITIDDKQQIFINDVPVGLDFLRRKMAAILENRQDRSVYLRADKSISYGLVVRVMAEVKGAGVQTLGMITEPLPSKAIDDERQDKKQ
jgi:biopolymer transport protein TolR